MKVDQSLLGPEYSPENQRWVPSNEVAEYSPQLVLFVGFSPFLRKRGFVKIGGGAAVVYMVLGLRVPLIESNTMNRLAPP